MIKELFPQAHVSLTTLPLLGPSPGGIRRLALRQGDCPGIPSVAGFAGYPTSK